MDSLGKSGVLLDSWIELKGSSFVLKEDLVDTFGVRVSGLWDWLDTVSVVFEVLVMIGVIFRLGHGL